MHAGMRVGEPAHAAGVGTVAGDDQHKSSGRKARVGVQQNVELLLGAQPSRVDQHHRLGGDAERRPPCRLTTTRRERHGVDSAWQAAQALHPETRDALRHPGVQNDGQRAVTVDQSFVLRGRTTRLRPRWSNPRRARCGGRTRARRCDTRRRSASGDDGSRGKRPTATCIDN